MAASNDSGLEQLLDQIKRYVGGGGLTGTPTSSNPSQTANTKPQPVASGTFTPPIHGQWFNVGDFAPGAERWYDKGQTDQAGQQKKSGHYGLDMSCSAGTPVYAASPGIVSDVGSDKVGGNIVWVDHANGLRTYYAHLSSVKVYKGDKVDSNTVLGSVGNTGNASHGFPHLHFSVHKGKGDYKSTAVNPGGFMSIPKYDPNYAHNPTKYLPWWTSDAAKQEAANFSMSDHVQRQKEQRRVAFSHKADDLMKLSNQFYKLVSGQSKSR